MEKQETWEDKIKVIVDGSRGIYVPLKFIVSFDWAGWGVTEDQLDVISDGPEGEDYWEAWEEVLRDAQYTDEDGMKWTLYHDDSLFVVREDMTDEDWEEFSV